MQVSFQAFPSLFPMRMLPTLLLVPGPPLLSSSELLSLGLWKYVPECPRAYACSRLSPVRYEEQWLRSSLLGISVKCLQASVHSHPRKVALSTEMCSRRRERQKRELQCQVSVKNVWYCSCLPASDTVARKGLGFPISLEKEPKKKNQGS